MEGNSKGRIAVCDDEIVVLRFTGEYHDRIEYHGHVITLKELEKRPNAFNPLLKAGLINFQGKILKNE